MSTEIENHLKMEYAETVKGIDKWMADFYYLQGIATRESHTHPEGIIRDPGRDENGKYTGELIKATPAERSPYNRLLRGEAYNRWKKDHADRPDMEFFHKLDEFDDQFRQQHEMEIDTPETGKQSLTYAEVCLGDEPKEDRETYFVISAYSGTRDGEWALVKALAFRGARVIVYDYPESHLNTKGPSEEFVKKMEESSDPDKPLDYGPHTALFAEGTKRLIPEGKHANIVGYSTGGPIVEEIIKKNPDLAEKIDMEIILSPISVVEQSGSSLIVGFRHEPFRTVPKDYKADKRTRRRINAVTTGVVLAPNHPEATTEEEKKEREEIQGRRDKVSKLLFSKVLRQSPVFLEPSEVPNMLKIMQFGGRDDATKSRRLKEGYPLSQNTVLLDCPQLSHVGPLWYADEMFAKIEEIRDDHERKKEYQLRIDGRT